jgi:hypothetical protein
MAYQEIYRLEFKNHAEQTCLLGLWKDTEDPPINVTYLTGSSSPVILKGIDNDKKINTPIRGTELSVEIVTSTLSFTTFIADNETTWQGIFKVNGSTVFVGFLLQEDSNEDFVSYNHVIRLRFTDSLALLKGVEFRDTNGNYWFADATLYDIINSCLRKTGLQLEITVASNLFPSDVVDTELDSFLSINKVNTRSFQTNKRDFADCYNVLTNILSSFGGTLYQFGGKWVIERWADKLEQFTHEFNYDTNGDPTFIGNDFTVLPIGENELIKEVESPKLFSVSRTSKENKITYRWENWPELIRNMDLDDGTINLGLSTSTQRTYSLDHYTQVNRTAYSRREIDTLGNETQRYFFILGAADNTDLVDYVVTSTFPAIKGDKLKVSFSASSKNDLPTTAALVYVKCGSYYLDDDGKWYTGAVFLRLDFASAENSTEWKTYEIESSEIPANGNVEVRFLLMQGCGVGNETRYKDFNIEYIRVINNAQSAVGDINNYPNSVTTKNPIDEQVYVSDSLKKVIKGALLKNNGDLETSWQRGTNSEQLRYSQLNALGYYQNTYRSKYKFEGVFKGRISEIGFKPLYSLADTPNKIYGLVSLDEVDYLRNIWRGTLLEVHDTVLDVNITNLPSTFVYNYLFE